MRFQRPLLRCLLVLVACGACTGRDSARSGAPSTSDADAIAADSARQAASADTLVRRARLTRLRTLQPTIEDLAARDSVDIRVEVDIVARRVRVNPEWIPPTDESWAKDEKGSAPGVRTTKRVIDLPQLLPIRVF